MCTTSVALVFSNLKSLRVFSLQGDGTVWAWPMTLPVLPPSETK